MADPGNPQQVFEQADAEAKEAEVVALAREVFIHRTGLGNGLNAWDAFTTAESFLRKRDERAADIKRRFDTEPAPKVARFEE